jgi:NAD(P)-dependent dehydrogenase (short-subunit alcohol dehydrogenase family)
VTKAGKLAGKIAIVTGSAAGIGRASCLPFAKRGASVAAVDCDADGNAKPVEEIRCLGGIAEALTALYLVSGDASLVTGSAVQIDGGMSL